jgi:hypothetical protein
MSVKFWKTLGMVTALTGLVTFGVGCPGGGGSVIEIWLINDSGEFDITSAVITNDSDSSQSEELVSGNLGTNSSRLIVLATTELFVGSTATVEISGSNSVSADTSVQIDESIMNGGIYPIVVKGDSAITYDAEYLPTDAGTKMLSTLEPLQVQ